MCEDINRSKFHAVYCIASELKKNSAQILTSLRAVFLIVFAPI